jgi:hypothetical protein
MITIEMNPYHVLEREIQHKREEIAVQTQIFMRGVL